MKTSFDILHELECSINKIAHITDAFDESFQADVRIAEARFGDFQANGILPYAKAKKIPPRQLGELLLSAIQKDPELDQKFITCEIAGPGFINLKLSPQFILKWLLKYKDEASYQSAVNNLYKNKNIVVDYSSPNTAKQMHVGHLRSMIIGEAVQRMLRLYGANIIRDNHIGDWGTQFGILIMAIKRAKYNLNAPHDDVLEDLEKLYKEGTALFKTDTDAKQAAYKELIDLQNEVPESFALWKQIRDVSWNAFESIYKQLDIEFDTVRGESFYRDKVDRIYKELKETGVAQESDGALVVFHPEHPRFKDFPLIIRKKDGTSNYASTDLATILDDIESFQANELLYVTDGRQQDHFQQLFLTAEKWFKAANYPLPVCKHVWFGTVLGEDGKAIKTRSGDPIKLKDLLNEAVERAYAIVNEKNSSLEEDEKKNIARVIGLGAVKYADLSQNRTGDYVFSWDKLLSFDGNTAPYLLYAVARIHSIFRKINIKPEAINIETISDFETETELALSRKLITFPIVLDQAIRDLRPHILCTFLYELAGQFSTFYNANKVIVEEDDLKNRRLLLCARTLSTLETGLHLLGIKTLEKM